jgi:hypothetical protein
MKKILRCVFVCCFVMGLSLVLPAQILPADTADIPNTKLDSLYIQEIEKKENLPYKVLHAEPLYIDLIRDLGARKGEKEWNIGAGLTDNLRFDTYEMLVEYEWAPIHRLGLEIEVPFTFYTRNTREQKDSLPSNRVESLKLAAQWSFLVSEKYKATLALGYIHEFELVDLNIITARNFFKGQVFNPFFVAAKRWGRNFHTLIYTGPRFEQVFARGETLPKWHNAYELHTNFHFMIPGTRNFIGVEFNKEFDAGKFTMVMRPQMRVSLADNLMIGIVTGVPINREEQRLSSFMRLIYEPSHRHK